jgi:prepilin-type N-terminal cleavage/methylation domain-containing protein/prepilin-type processing-associated H-X9-DG protein
MNKKAFTLIELLVVISIIALLMAIMLPALGRARDLAKSAVCRSNLKQIVLGAVLWAEDNDGWSVPTTWAKGDYLTKDNWSSGVNNFPNPGSLERYIASSDTDPGKVMACPGAKSEAFFNWGGELSSEDRSKKVTYGSNAWMTLTTDYNGDRRGESPGSAPDPRYYYYNSSGNPYAWTHGVTKLAKVRQPGQTIYFTDNFYYVTQPAFYTVFEPKTVYGVESVSRWHNKKKTTYNGKTFMMGSANMGWVDGSVSVEPEDFDRVPQGGETPRWCYYFWDH